MYFFQFAVFFCCEAFYLLKCIEINGLRSRIMAKTFVTGDHEKNGSKTRNILRRDATKNRSWTQSSHQVYTVTYIYNRTIVVSLQQSHNSRLVKRQATGLTETTGLY